MRFGKSDSLNKKNNKPIVLYWAIKEDADNEEDWSFLYPKPKSVFSDLLKYKALKDNSTLFSCPGFSNKFKKTLTFFSPMSCSYFYDNTENKQHISNTTKNFISAYYPRTQNLTVGPSINFKLNVIFFSEESLDMSFTPPFFHPAEYTKYGSVISGKYNVGKWFRPTNFEVQMWSNSGEFHLKENEPVFYTEFDTDRPVILKRFKMNEQLIKYSNAVVNSTKIFNFGQSLTERYFRFNNVGMREKILTEINKNLINEEPYKF